MTALSAAGAGHADAVPGPGVLGVGAVPVLRRPRRRAGRRGAEGPRRVPGAVSQHRAITSAQPALDDPADARDVRALQARFRGARHVTRPPTRCIATCSRCGATRRRFRASARGGVDGAVLSASAFVLRFFARAIDDDRAADRQPRRRPDRRVVRRAAARAAGRSRLGAGVVERGSALRRRRHARLWATGGVAPARRDRAWCSRRRRDARPRAPTVRRRTA